MIHPVPAQATYPSLPQIGTFVLPAKRFAVRPRRQELMFGRIS